jgi:hypothetical protein
MFIGNNRQFVAGSVSVSGAYSDAGREDCAPLLDASGQGAASTAAVDTPLLAGATHIEII